MAFRVASFPQKFEPPAVVDAGLRRVLEAWPTLPAPLRAAVLAIVEAATKPQNQIAQSAPQAQPVHPHAGTLQ